MDHIYTDQLSNGIKILHKPNQSLIAHAGIIIKTGSRDENNEEHGFAHLTEHMLFKGTGKRKGHHIINRVEHSGGEINAYTTKEYTCIYCTFLKEDYKKIIELLHDIIFHSTFPAKELDKEKEIIKDEITSYLDTPSEQIFDDFEELFFPDHPLGRNILGSTNTLMKIQQNNLLNFFRSKYNTDEMVISSVGDLSVKAFQKIINTYFETIPAKKRNHKRIPAPGASTFNISKNMKTHQAHCLLGSTGYALTHPGKNGLQLLNNLLGGPGLNARLNVSLREKNGVAYNIESQYVPYTDTGIFIIYFGTDPKNINKGIKLIHSELNNLKQKKLGTLQLSRAKKQLLGQIAMDSENKEHEMISLGKNYLFYNHTLTISQIYNRYEQITAKELIEIANEVLDVNKLSTLIYQP